MVVTQTQLRVRSKHRFTRVEFSLDYPGIATAELSYIPRYRSLAIPGYPGGTSNDKLIIPKETRR